MVFCCCCCCGGGGTTILCCCRCYRRDVIDIIPCGGARRGGLQDDDVDGLAAAVIQGEDGASGVLSPGDDDAGQADELDRVVVVEVEVLAYVWIAALA